MHVEKSDAAHGPCIHACMCLACLVLAPGEEVYLYCVVENGVGDVRLTVVALETLALAELCT